MPRNTPQKTGNTGRRILTVLLLLGIGAIFLSVGPGLYQKWVAGSQASSPPSGQAAAASVTNDGEVFDLQWPAFSQDDAPALTLHGLAKTKSRHPQADSNNPASVVLSLVVPDGSRPAAEPVCENSSTLFTSCSGALARLEIFRESDRREERQRLLSTQALPAQDSEPYAKRSTRSYYSFWTKENADGDSFQGWACTAAEQSARSNLALFFTFPAGPDAACFRPKNSWEKIRPSWFGYEQHTLYVECKPDEDCRSWFLFQGRLVDVYYAFVAPRNATQSRTQIISTAWNTLSKLQQATPPKVNLAQAEAQAESCSRFSADMANIPEEGASYHYNMPHYLREICQSSGTMTLQLAAQNPEQALPLLRTMATALSLPVGEKASNKALLDKIQSAHLQALASSGQGESLEMLETLIASLELARSIESSDAAQARVDSTVPKIFTLFRKHGGAVSAKMRNTVLVVAGTYYLGPENHEKWDKLHNDMVSYLAAVYGDSSAELISPLQQIALGDQVDGRFIELKSSTDRLAAVILAQPQTPQYMSNNSDAESLSKEKATFDAVLFYRNFGFHEKRFGEAAAGIAPLVARLEKVLGPDAPLTQGARYHQQEVLTGRPGNGQIGGGFLPRQTSTPSWRLQPATS